MAVLPRRNANLTVDRLFAVCYDYRVNMEVGAGASLVYLDTRDWCEAEWVNKRADCAWVALSAPWADVIMRESKSA